MIVLGIWDWDWDGDVFVVGLDASVARSWIAVNIDIRGLFFH